MADPAVEPGADWAAVLRRRRGMLGADPAPVVEGRLVRMVGLTLEAEGCRVAVGDRCRIETANGLEVEAEVVGFAEQRVYLMAIGSTHGLTPGARVVPISSSSEVPAGEALLGRVVDGAGQPIDGLGPLRNTAHVPLVGRPLNPLQRPLIDEPLDVGIRAINAMLSVGRGQRMGLFAGSGVGKSVLLGMMTRHTEADVTVVGLIGERGREVKEFIDQSLGPAGLARAVVVATPADHSPLMRLHGAMLATAIAEHFRDQGKNVLLLIDSLTRFAQAQREIALAIGEPPATKGYPPSVFTRIPQLVERAGNGDRGGSITAFYTVLAEGDDHNDPIVDAARAALDGHIMLSRELADGGHYPAIDIEASVSRSMHGIVDAGHMAAARRLKRLYALYQRNRDMISVGAYQAGLDPAVDEAIAIHPRVMEFLAQTPDQHHDWQQSVEQLEELVRAAPPAVTA